MLDPVQEAYARLSMLEFALEVVIANHLSDASLVCSQKFKDDFVKMMRSPDLSSPALCGSFSHEREQLEAEISRRSVEMAERFVQKVAARETDIRAQKSAP